MIGYRAFIGHQAAVITEIFLWLALQLLGSWYTAVSPFYSIKPSKLRISAYDWSLAVHCSDQLFFLHCPLQPCFASQKLCSSLSWWAVLTGVTGWPFITRTALFISDWATFSESGSWQGPCISPYVNFQPFETSFLTNLYLIFLSKWSL